MTSSRALTVLVVLIALLAIVVTAAGVFTGGGPGPSTFTTINGTTTSIYGVGLYRKGQLAAGPGHLPNSPPSYDHGHCPLCLPSLE